MSARTAKTWLVAYDIRQPKRLRRVHRCLRREGMALQYSAFGVQADDPAILRLLDRIEELIDVRVDDVRAYHVPERCLVWRLGRQDLPEGVQLEGALAARELIAVAATTSGDDAE